MGGLQEATRWRGPMLTDSGGYQIFSMGHGSVGDEIKGRRGAEGGAQFGEEKVEVLADCAVSITLHYPDVVGSLRRKRVHRKPNMRCRIMATVAICRNLFRFPPFFGMAFRLWYRCGR